LAYPPEGEATGLGDAETNPPPPIEAARPASQTELDLTPVAERLDYPPLLNVVMPVLMLVVSGAYAWSLRDMVNPGMNLLLLKPLFVVIWALLLIVLLKDVVPSIRLHALWRTIAPATRPSWSQRFAPGTESGAGLIVAATFLFSLYGPGHGAVAYLVGTFIYLMVVGYLIGDRHPVKLTMQAGMCAATLYLLMGVALGVRL
jgi:hypothetical protein